MAGMEWTLEIVLVVMLGATLVQAIKLERALGVLKRDRASLEMLVAHFNTSTHQAENGIERLRAAADGAGRHIEHQLTQSVMLKDDLAFLTERGERLADRLDTLVRSARPLTQERPLTKERVGKAAAATPSSGTSQVERNLLQALRLAR
jgi:chromosome segregation ATPase